MEGRLRFEYTTVPAGAQRVSVRFHHFHPSELEPKSMKKESAVK